MKKKIDWLKISKLIKNQLFLSNQADIQATLPTHELVILTKFHKGWQKIVKFSDIKILSQSNFFASVSSLASPCAPAVWLGFWNSDHMFLKQ